MSRSAESTLLARLRRRLDPEGGFTLIEVIVALVIFAMAATAGAGLLIAMQRGSVMAKLDTGAKTLSQGELEFMRNLPWHIDYDVNGTAVTNRSDLFDYFYANLTAAGTISGSSVPCGYVSAAQTGSSYRLAGEPASGAFYRTVIPHTPVCNLLTQPSGFSRYTQYVDVQFLDSNRSPVTPPTGYDTQASGVDYPASPLVGVTVITKWKAGTMSHKLVVPTEISNARPANPLVSLQGQMTAVRLTSALGADRDLTMELGDVSMNGALSTGVTAAADTDTGYAQIAPGSRFDGATQHVSGPPNATAATLTASAQTLTDQSASGTPSLACFGGTTSSNLSASTSTGQPVVGSSAAPITSNVSGSGCGSYGAYFTNEPAPDSRLQIDTSKPMVFATTSGGGTVAQGSGFLASTAGAGHVAGFTGSASTTSFSLLPTTFAPSGIIQVSLTSASVTCQTGGSSATVSATPTYAATIKYWKYSSSGSGYQTVSLSGTQAADPLAALSLATDTTGIQVAVDSSGNPLYLGNYITNWSSATQGSLGSFAKVDPDYKTLTGSSAGLITLSTVATRSGDTTSPIAMQVAPMSCQAEDER